MMKNLFFKSLLIVGGFVISLNSINAQTALYPKQGDYRAIKDGSWGNPDTWVRWHNSRGWQEGLFDYIAPPGRLSTVVIAAGVTVYMDNGAMIPTWLSAMRNGGEGRTVEYPYACSKLILEPGAKIISTADHNLVADSIQITHPFDGAVTTNAWDTGGYILKVYGDSILNDGALGGAGADGMILEMGAPYTQGMGTNNAYGFRLTGAGSATISKLRMVGGNIATLNHPGPDVVVNIQQNMAITGAGYGFTAVYKPKTSDYYTLRVHPGFTITLTNPDGEIHHQALTGATTVSTGGLYTYDIDGTIDATASNKVMTFTRLASPSSVITVDVTPPGKLIVQHPLFKGMASNSTGQVIFLPASGSGVIVLPLDILSFSAKLTEGKTNKVTLNWSTANERNTRAFDIERSNDGKDFSAIGTVNTINSNGVHNYSYVDNSPFIGVSYYRLKQTDIDGKHKYSVIATINAKLKSGFVTFPNPAKDRLNVVFDRLIESGRIDILSLDGKLIQTNYTSQGSTQTTLDISRLVPGNYMIRVQNGSEVNVLKFIKN
jgi:hypothetical protein